MNSEHEVGGSIEQWPSEPVTVAFLTQSAQLSGCELFLLRVTSAMTHIRPIVILGEHGPLEDALSAVGVEHHVLPLDESTRSHTARQSVVSPASLGKLKDVMSVASRIAGLCRARGVRIVTTHSAKAHLYGGIAARLAGLRGVCHLHSVVGVGGGRRGHGAILRTAMRVLPHELIANSATTAASIGRNRKPVAVVGCPVDVPATVAPEPAEPVIAVVGRLAAGKGQDVVLRAYAEVLARGLPPTVRLRLIGDALFETDRAFPRHLPTLAHELGIADSVEFVGHSDDAVGEMARATVVVHASTSPEGFGQVVLEAMALGRTVVSSDAGGPAELITDGHDGVLVPAGDVSALARVLSDVLHDEAKRAAFGDRARRTASRYALPSVVEALERALLCPAP